MRIRDWSSDVCSSDLGQADTRPSPLLCPCRLEQAERCSIGSDRIGGGKAPGEVVGSAHRRHHLVAGGKQRSRQVSTDEAVGPRQQYAHRSGRSEERTSELQSLMRISYAVFCLKNKKTNNNKHTQQY